MYIKRKNHPTFSMMIVIDGIIKFYLLLPQFCLFNVPLNLHILDLELFEFGFSQVTIF